MPPRLEKKKMPLVVDTVSYILGKYDGERRKYEERETRPHIKLEMGFQRKTS